MYTRPKKNTTKDTEGQANAKSKPKKAIRTPAQPEPDVIDIDKELQGTTGYYPVKLIHLYS